MKLLPILLIFLAACGGGKIDEIENLEEETIKTISEKDVCEELNQLSIDEVFFERDMIFLPENPLRNFNIKTENSLHDKTVVAINQWNKALGIDLLNISESYSINIEYFPFSEIENEKSRERLINYSGYAFFKNRKTDGEYCNIRINSEKEFSNLNDIIIHEIGHCLGLQHDLTNKNSIMNKTVKNNCIPNYLVDLIYERYNL